MEVSAHHRLHVGDASGPGEARRLASALAKSLGFGETDVGRVGIIVTEVATNVVKHAGGGELLLHGLGIDGARGLSVLGLDRGPGLANLADAMRDGFSSTGTPGTGLGAIRRLATLFDAYSQPGVGAALLATVWPSPPVEDPSGLVSGGINVAHDGETVSGDAWLIRPSPQRTIVLLADGLGHGAGATQAAEAAAAVFRQHAALSPAALLERVHAALRATRGAAVGIAEIDRDKEVLRFAGIGNTAGTIFADGVTRSVVSLHGTAGHDARRIKEFTYPWPRGAMLVMHSDGLTSRWTFDGHPGLASHHPALIAGVLYRDFKRGRDDTSVVVLREAA